MTFDELLTLVCSRATRVCTDSRLVKTGDVFVAVKGAIHDGHDFIGQAVAAGAACVVCTRPYHHNTAAVTRVEDSAKAAALLAQAANGWPASNLTNLAVTGTNGKTTVAFLVRSIIAATGQKCGLIGTIVYDTGDSRQDAALTTPDCAAIARMQRKMLDVDAKYMVIEASSHALSQNRLAGIDFKTAAFTNLSGDHLDYHKTEQNYLAAKSSLFERLSPDATAVLNGESPHSHFIAAKTPAKVLWYAVDAPADVTARIETMDTTGTVFTVKYEDHRHEIKTPLLGRYNLSNNLAAAGLCLAAGFDLETIAAGLSDVDTIPGRLERLDPLGGAGPSVLIDYAHTDDALKNVLSTVRLLCKHKLVVVFGCGGDRDKTKRPRMARVAEQFADQIIVTSDNPRNEEPADIIKDIVAGFESPDSRRITIEPDREKAIDTAVKAAAENDIVLIAGKGHETYQIIKEQRFEFSDKAVALRCLEKRR